MSPETSPRPFITKNNDIHDTPTPESAPLQGVPVDRARVSPAVASRIVSKWRRLDQLHPKSREYSLLIKSLLETEVDRKATTSLGGEDAAVVLDILAKVRIDLYPARSHRS